jgi:site-specific DNA recombinase
VGTKAGIWLRVSTGAQDEDNQEPKLRAYCDLREYDIAREYRLGGRSASKGEQDADLQRALEDMQDGVIEVLVCWHSDRLERRGPEAIFSLKRRAREAGGRIESVLEPTFASDDLASEMTTAVSSINAKHEVKRDVERTALSFERIRKNGGVIGRAPFGYAVAGERYNKTFVPTDDGRKYVPAIFERVIRGDSTRDIGDWLRSENVTTRQGSNVWSSWGIGHIVRNAAYMGLRKDENGKQVGRCEALVDASTWKAANKALTEHAKPKGHARKNSALLTGILRCAKCSGPMYRTNIGKGASAQLVYRCAANPKFGSARKSDCANLIRVELADAFVRSILTGANAPVMERRRIHAANQPSDRVIEIEQELSSLDYGAPGAQEHMMTLMTERQSLADVPDVPDTWELIPTGETWAQVYARMTDDSELGKALRSMGVEIYLDSRTFPEWSAKGLGDVFPFERVSV